ncbi:MAG: hypothetical protein KatS3mg131_3107 [Candidatus Tectimicrobiota bacterium]|nr:MAG: hypothetical protein KatS3mg131_3107 [Candidatus Tectomicrobia bacterium]
MNAPQDDRLQPAEQAFVGRLARHFAPPPLSAARRAAFDAAVWARLQRRRRRRRLLPAGAAAAAALLWLLFSGHPGERLPPAETRSDAMPLLQAVLEDALAEEESAVLPAEYRVLAQVFLDRPWTEAQP